MRATVCAFISAILCISNSGQSHAIPIADIHIIAGQSNAYGPHVLTNEFVANYCESGYFNGFLTSLAGTSQSHLACQNDKILYSFDVGTTNANAADGIVNGEFSDPTLLTTLTPTPRGINYVRFGPEIPFIKALINSRLEPTTHQPVIIKVAFGSSGIQAHWLDNTQFFFLQRLITRLQTTIQNLQGMGYEVHIKSFIWIQGERDVMNGNPDYFANLKQLIYQLRTASRQLLGAATFKVVIMRTPMIAGHEASSCNIRCAQQYIATVDPYVSLVSADGLIKKDLFHFTPDGWISLGESLFTGYVSRTRSLYNKFCSCQANAGNYTGAPLLQ